MYLILQLLSTAASILFLLLLPFRLRKLLTEPIKLVPSEHGYAKPIIAVVLLTIHLIRLITVLSSNSQLDVGILSSIASVPAYIGLCPLLFLEHTRSSKPSDLATLYLLVSAACNFAELGTSIYGDGTISIPISTIATLFIECVLLIAENQGKQRILRDPYCQKSPEQLAGILNRTFFWWINSILIQGNRNVLTGDNLPFIDQEFSSSLLRRKALRAWDRRVKPETKTTLPKTLVLSMLSHFLAPILPRILLIVFRYAQPVLIGNAIRFMSESSDKESKSGYSLILMATVVYCGLAISKAVYYHLLNRLKIMIRGAIVGLINSKSLTQQSSNFDDGRAVTLMSTDAENVGQSVQMFHETWAQMIEVLVGTAMLAREVGWVFPVPLMIIFFCSRMSRYMAKNLGTQQKNWNEATQERLAMTVSMLSSMKGLKMLGVTTYVESLVQKLRVKELDMAKKVRWMMVANNASANALGILSPIVTFVLFVILAGLNGTVLDTETAFTTTALLGLVTNPANMIMTIVPQAVGSLAAFVRIQEYLLQSPRRDERLILKGQDDSNNTKASLAICTRQMAIQTNPQIPPILKNIDINIIKNSLVICSGPVGSGKTTLAKALMGEVPIASGTVSVSSKHIGSCAQSPWLPSGTLKEAICGFSPEEETWYQTVVSVCCLDNDLLELPEGDQTMIGSRGLNLSGGQRQRVALARVVYARCEIAILDDSLSALDSKTANRIVENLLGPEGMFKKMGTTVFLITNATQYFHLADCLVVLGDSSVKHQGTWADLAPKLEHTNRVTVNENNDDSAIEQLQKKNTSKTLDLKIAEASSDLRRRTGDFSLYGYYILSVGYRNFFLLLACTASYSFFITFPQYWLKWWTEAPPSETTFYIGGYLILSLTAWACTNGSMWSTHILIAPVSGVELHRRLLSTIIGAPLSYFSVTDTGTILNRFVIIAWVDRQLPQALLSISNQVFKLSVQTVLLFSAQKLMALTIPICMITIYIVQKVYLRTSRQLRLLELESQSAVYSSFLESIEGVATIRAFGWEKEIENATVYCLDKAQQPFYLLFCLQRWLSLVLDLIVALLATGIITLAVLMKGTTTGGQIGMALNIVLVANSTLLALVQSWTDLEISLGAISRLKTLEAETPEENKPSESYSLPEDWPTSGAIEFDDVTVAYNSEALALQNITMKISPGQQFTICGRTGSGKSTLLLTLLRVLEARSGTIKIDGIDISKVPQSLIRQKCFITVPQDPLILGQASLRFNLDPSASISDKSIVAALQKTRLWVQFTSENSAPLSRTAQEHILDTSMASLPQMSTGQSQLFALARAILHVQVINHPSGFSDFSQPNLRRTMPVLLLDEATSSVDPETESIMRSIIYQEFTEKRTYRYCYYT